MRKTLSLVSALALVVLSGGRAAEPPTGDKGKDAGFGDLIGALKATPGCLGVETARTGSGKEVIFAWFEDKKAALKWYYSDVHQELMKKFFPDAKSTRKPLADVAEGSGPIMIIASITLNAKPTKENPSPFKQIAVELYQPRGGGLSVGGRFAPDKMKLPEPRKPSPEK